jgi:hypothetical protein
VTPFLRAGLLVGVAGAVTLFAWLWRFNDPFVSDDHWGYVLPGWQMLYGDLPVRDFVEIGLPLYHVVAAAVQVVGGRGLLAEVVFAVTVLAVCTGALFLLCYRASGSIAFAVAGAVFYVLSAPRFYGYPKILVTVVAIPALWAFADRPGWRRVTILAAITAFGCLLRHDHGVYLAIAFLVWLLCLTELSLQRRVQYVLFYAGLVCVFMVPYLMYVAITGDVLSYLSAAVDWARRDVGRTPLEWPSLTAVSGMLSRDAAMIQSNWVAWLFYGELLVPVAAAGLLAISPSACRPMWSHASAKVGAVVLLGFVFNAGFLVRSPIEARLGDPAAPLAVLMSWMLTAVVARLTDRRPGLGHPVALAASVVATLMIVALLTVVALASSSGVSRHIERIGLDRGVGEALEQTERLWGGLAGAVPIGFELPLAPDSLTTLTVFVRECTRPGDRVFLTNYLPQVLGLAERAFAAGLPPYANQGVSADVQRWAVQRLRQQSVPIAFVGSGPSWGSFRHDLPILTAYFDAHYWSAGERVFDGRFGLRLLVRRDATIVSTFEPLGWPCVR